MEECQGRKYVFESMKRSGVMIFVIDDAEPVHLKFGSIIKIQVLFDEPESWLLKNDDKSADSAGCCNLVCADVLYEPKSTDHDDIEIDDIYAGNSPISTSIKWAPKDRKAKDSVPLSECEYSGLPEKRRIAAQSTGCGTHVQREGKDLQDSETRIDNTSESDQHSKAYKKKLRSSNKLVKMISKLPKAVRATKAPKTLLKTKFRKKEMSKKYLTKQSTKEDIKSEIVEEPNVQTKERQRKLLINKTIKCEYCCVDFKNQQAFYDHRRGEESVHKCGICGKVEPYEAHLIVHMQRHRRVKVETASNIIKTSGTEVSTDSEIIQSSERKSKKEKMKCNICGLVVSSMDSLKIHTFLHTGEYAYRCCVCGEHFSSLSSRQHHMDIHISAQRFKCNPCGERFTSRAELAKHQLTHEIKCALCGEIFPNKTSRSCHFRVSHPDDILKCSLCTNLFATVEDLEKHLTYHKKGKKEQCPVCGVVVSKLKDHMLMHSQVAQEKLFACDQCPMRYLRKSNLDRHMRTHTGEKPYACNKCPKSFRSNGMLRKHLLTHTKEKPYQCEVCGKQCSLRSNLNIHMRVHNSDRHFPCGLCSQAFNHKNSLHGHMKNKHAQGLHMEMKLNMPAHTSHQLSLPSNIVTDMDKCLPYSDKHIHTLDLAMGMSPNLDPDLLKAENRPDYSLHEQMNYAVSMPGGMTSNLLMDSERLALNKFDIHPHTGHSHSY